MIKTTRHVTKMLPSVTVLGDRTALLVLLGFFSCPSSLDVFLQVRMVTLMVIMMEWRMAKMVRMIERTRDGPSTPQKKHVAP